MTRTAVALIAGLAAAALLLRVNRQAAPPAPTPTPAPIASPAPDPAVDEPAEPQVDAASPSERDADPTPVARSLDELGAALLAAPADEQYGLVFRIAQNPAPDALGWLVRFVREAAPGEESALMQAMVSAKQRGPRGVRQLLASYDGLDARRRKLMAEVMAMYREPADRALVDQLELAEDDPLRERWALLAKPRRAHQQCDEACCNPDAEAQGAGAGPTR